MGRQRHMLIVAFSELPRPLRPMLHTGTVATLVVLEFYPTLDVLRVASRQYGPTINYRPACSEDDLSPFLQRGSYRT